MSSSSLAATDMFQFTMHIYIHFQAKNDLVNTTAVKVATKQVISDKLPSLFMFFTWICQTE